MQVELADRRLRPAEGLDGIPWFLDPLGDRPATEFRRAAAAAGALVQVTVAKLSFRYRAQEVFDGGPRQFQVQRAAAPSP